MQPLPTLRGDLRRHLLDDQLLVYDPINDHVHLLDSITAKVVGLMENGASAESIVDHLKAQHGPHADGDLLALTLDQLAAAGLLAETQDAVPTGMHDGTRRQMLQKVAAVGLGFLVPTILTLTPRLTYAQASGFGLGSACDSSSQCLNGCCQQGTSGACVNKTCVNPATACAVCRSP
jgi:hypothetical protein